MKNLLILPVCFFLFYCSVADVPELKIDKTDQNGVKSPKIRTDEHAEASSEIIEKNKSEIAVSEIDEEKEYISHVEKVGRLIYEKDIRAARATDILLENINPSDFPDFAGWVTYPNEGDFTVMFYEQFGDAFTIMADVLFSPARKPVLKIKPDRVAEATELSMIKARLAALSEGGSPCSRNSNTVIIPSDKNRVWDVYIIGATTNPNIIPVGGHLKVQVSSETGEVMNRMPLSKSCLAITKSGEGFPEGATAVGVHFSHIVTTRPLAVHVYLNLLHGLDFFIGSKSGKWKISEGMLSRLE